MCEDYGCTWTLKTIVLVIKNEVNYLDKFSFKIFILRGQFKHLKCFHLWLQTVQTESLILLENFYFKNLWGHSVITLQKKLLFRPLTIILILLGMLLSPPHSHTNANSEQILHKTSLTWIHSLKLFIEHSLQRI